MTGGDEVMMLRIARRTSEVSFFMLVLAIGSSAQTGEHGAAKRVPSKPARPFVVRSSQSLAELEAQLPANKVEELFGGEGMQLRVAVQYDKDKPSAQAEVHDASDDVYYVLEGSASLTLGGQLDAPGEVQPGEWRARRIVGGQTFEIKKGDLVIVPRGTPHQRSTAGREFKMLLIKVFAVPVPAAQKQPARKEQKP
jgi:mannose-6-phosphate isomerase-like protein (cupin superfamily)